MDQQDVVYVESLSVSCDGGAGASNHPLVFLKLKDGEVTCPYCSKVFRLKEGAVVHDHH